MSIIVVTGIPYNWNFPKLVKKLTPYICGAFEALKFGNEKSSVKSCYIRLSQKLNAVNVVNQIKNGASRFSAFIPNEVPDDLPQSASKRGKPKLKARLAMRIPTDDSPGMVMVHTHQEILVELQSKYIGLFNLSRKTGHKLMECIAQTVFERLRPLMLNNTSNFDSGFKLSRAYRKLFPHFGDFQLILSTLHRLQDAAGAPRTQIQESELSAVTSHPCVIDNIPFKKVRAVCLKYTDRITKKVAEHIRGLVTDMHQLDGEEDIARKKVRQELKTMAPYMPDIIKQVVTRHFSPKKCPRHRFRIYGEPFLPPAETMTPFVKRHRGVKIMRSDRMFNLLRFNVPLMHYTGLMAMDGTVLGGSKLVIRSSDIPLYSIPKSLTKSIVALFGEEDPEGMDINIKEEEEDEGGEEDADGDEEEWSEEE